LPTQDSTGINTARDVQLEERRSDKIALLVAILSAAVFLASTWFIILSSNPKSLGFFAFHPSLQSLGICLILNGILTLQPTSQPQSKASGLARHQFLILYFGIPSLLLGGTAIAYNKYLHDAPHGTSWHATFGAISLLWLLLQALLGGASVWYSGALLGGPAKAKLLWKYHRLSGYILFPTLLLTAHLGGTYSTWMTMNAGFFLRFGAYTVAPALIVCTVYSRVRLSKMKIF